MQCFYHDDAVAVGSCRACLRGLCRRCAVELDCGLACNERCEALARTVVASLRQTARYQSVSTGILRSARGLWLALTAVSLFVGVFVVAWALSLPVYREISLLGIPFFLLTIVSARLARNARPAPPSDESKQKTAA